MYRRGHYHDWISTIPTPSLCPPPFGRSLAIRFSSFRPPSIFRSTGAGIIAYGRFHRLNLAFMNRTHRVIFMHRVVFKRVRRFEDIADYAKRVKRLVPMQIYSSISFARRTCIRWSGIRNVATLLRIRSSFSEAWPNAERRLGETIVRRIHPRLGRNGGTQTRERNGVRYTDLDNSRTGYGRYVG